MTVLQALTLVFHIFLKIVNLLESLLLNSTRLNCVFCVSYLGACFENLLLPNDRCRVVFEIPEAVWDTLLAHFPYSP